MDDGMNNMDDMDDTLGVTAAVLSASPMGS